MTRNNILAHREASEPMRRTWTALPSTLVFGGGDPVPPPPPPPPPPPTPRDPDGRHR